MGTFYHDGKPYGATPPPYTGFRRKLDVNDVLAQAGVEDIVQFFTKLDHKIERNEGDDVAFVTVYFNPLGYRSRLLNYWEFRTKLEEQGTPVYTFQAVIGDQEQEIPDHDTVHTVRSSDVMWHKERMINRMVELLPARFTKIAWVDCDLVWSEPIHRKVSETLDRVPVMQLFKWITLLGPNGRPLADRVTRHRQGFAAAFLNGNKKHPSTNNPPGGAWAAHRELFTHFGGLYDKLLTGGADCFAATAFSGHHYSPMLEMVNAQVRWSYENWAKHVRRYMRGNMAALDVHCVHLFHGARKNKQYQERMEALLNYDPETDIGLDEQTGLWKWTTDKTNLVQGFTEYFKARDEDSDEE